MKRKRWLVGLWFLVHEKLAVRSAAMPSDHLRTSHITLVQQRGLHSLAVLLDFSNSNGLFSVLLDIPQNLPLFFELEVLLYFALQFCSHLLFQKAYLQLHPPLFYLLQLGFKFFALSVCKLERIERGIFCGFRERKFIWDGKLLLCGVYSLRFVDKRLLVLIGRILGDNCLYV